MEKHPRIQEEVKLYLDQGDSFDATLFTNQKITDLNMEATPWLSHALREKKQREGIVKLFDRQGRMSELGTIYRQLKDNQLGNGAFPWVRGGRASYWTSLYIASLFVDIKELTGANLFDPELQQIITPLLNYLDDEFLDHYHRYFDRNPEHYLYGWTVLSYMKLRHSFPQDKVDGKLQKAMDEIYERGKGQWVKHNKTQQIYLGHIAHQRNDDELVNAIIKSMKEYAIDDARLGRYWKESWSYHWYSRPTFFQSQMIALFYKANVECGLVGTYEEMVATT